MSSRGTIDLRKRKPGGHTRVLPFTWGPRSPKLRGRNSPLRTRRRRVRALWMVGILLLIAALLYGARAFSYAPSMSIENVAIVGTEHVPAELIKTHVETTLIDDAFSFLSRQNIFLYPKKALEISITKHFPRIKMVHISRESLLARAITVSVEERQAYGRWCMYDAASINTQCYLLDRNGYLFAEDSSNSEARYTFKGQLSNATSPVGQTFLSDHFSEVVVLLDQLEQSSFSPRTITIEEGKDFSIQLARGYRILVSFGNVEKIIHNLELILSSDALRGSEGELEYVDLRFGNRVYYKFKGGEVQSQ